MGIGAKERFEARISAQTKTFLKKAADLQGLSLSNFVIAAAQAKAYEIIEQYQTLQLDLAASEAFTEALLNPPQPNLALKVAAQRYQQEMSEE